MELILVGLNHETAPVELREKLGFQSEHLPRALSQLCSASAIEEGVIISTCNRVEVYAVAHSVQDGVSAIITFLSQFHRMDGSDFKSHMVTMTGLDVPRHLFSVASSLKSMVLGETQIQCQIKSAFEAALACGSTGAILSALFQNALTTGKRVRNETSISEHSLSISSTAVSLVRKRLPDLSNKHVLVVGNGKMGVLAIKALLKSGVGELTLVNRTEESAQELARDLGLTAHGLDHLEDDMARADVVISSTGAPHAVITRDMAERVAQRRNHRPLLLIDIAVPRDIEPDVSTVAGVSLFNIDQLQDAIESNREKRAQEMARAEAIISEELEHYQSWLQTLEVKPTIKRLRKRAEQIREAELQRALRRFESNLSENDSQLLKELTSRIVNKMLHEPIAKLRTEAAGGNGQNYTLAINQLFGLEEKKAMVEGES